MSGEPFVGEWFDCWNCDGEGFIADCFDGFCRDAEWGCNDCSRICSLCKGQGGWEASEPLTNQVAPATDAAQVDGKVPGTNLKDQSQ